LLIEQSPVTLIPGPPQARESRHGAAPGKLQTPNYDRVEVEFERARKLLGNHKEFEHLTLLAGIEGAETGPISDRALTALLNGLGIKMDFVQQPGTAPVYVRKNVSSAKRQERQVKELEEYTQKIVQACEHAREDFLWNKIKTTSTSDWQSASSAYRRQFREDVIGAFPLGATPLNARTRRLDSLETAGGPEIYEVVLDVLPDVFAWGYLLKPPGLQSNEHRPVVVCQHGLEGVPADVVNQDTNTQAFRYYKAFARRLAEKGFVVFAPHNPYRGGDNFRVLQRKANPIGKSLFSVITAQHEVILKWLGDLPFVDRKRMGFYGLSYGGKTAMRVPAALEGYALSICSGDFNEWVRKNAAIDAPASYIYSGEYEMPEWDLGHTFNYAEMAALIAPRPFMVERGHNDGVGADEWVAYEFAKVKRFYDELGIGERTEIEFFNGPHTIHGVGTFQFLQRWLDYPSH
jgi:dienelactone hydrolase